MCWQNPKPVSPKIFEHAANAHARDFEEYGRQQTAALLERVRIALTND